MRECRAAGDGARDRDDESGRTDATITRKSAAEERGAAHGKLARRRVRARRTEYGTVFGRRTGPSLSPRVRITADGPGTDPQLSVESKKK